MSQLCTKVNKLLNKMKCGNEDAYKQLIDCVFNKLIFIAANYLVNKTQAEDVALEAMISVSKHIKTFDETKDGYNWICKIVENKAKDYNKSEKVFEELNAETLVAKDCYEEIEIRIDTDNILKQLDDEEYIYITERFYWDKTYEEIAIKMGVSTKQAYVKIKKILKS